MRPWLADAVSAGSAEYGLGNGAGIIGDLIVRISLTISS